VSHFEHLGPHPSHAAARELKEVITRKRVTLAALSVATGIPRSTLGRKLRGQGDLTVTELVRLAVALDVAAADLVAGAIDAARVDDSGTQDNGDRTQAGSGPPFSGGES
jgi:transcriptional regulator with XRE-family HTH domain